MAQTKEGALKVSAKKAGLTLDEYKATLESGLKRCTRCKAWKPLSDFGNDRSRSDGLDASCLECRHVKVRKVLKGRESTFRGHKHSDEAKRKMSLARKGKPSPRRGVPRTPKDRIKISIGTREKTPRGEECHSYKDGKAAERRGQRFSMQYKRWRFDVYSRDNFTCQRCGDARGGNLHAHHIKPFADYPELRFDVSNGVTLCEECHKREHSKA